MAEAVFYTRVADTHRLLCKLVQKAARTPGRVLVWLEDEEALRHFDGLLWSFEATAFVPHEVCAVDALSSSVQSDVVLSCGAVLPESKGFSVVVNSAPAAPWYAVSDKPQRVIEAVEDDTTALAAARLRFRAYREAGFAITHHDMAGRIV